MKLEDYKKLVKKKQPEGKLQSEIGAYLNSTFLMQKSNDLVFFTYSGAGEKKTIKTAVLQKRKGLQKGDFDYRFEIKRGDILHMIYIEIKSQSGALTKEQKQFLKMKENLKNVACYVCVSFYDFIEILKKEKIIK